ncbi:DUF6874 family protein [Microvirga sesbaniae]|uniref:DUF6874 family protein n=1 Tax=Microvirga sesbaniae TaxID=681392 RepID=UPI0021C74939|nr:hypothetical protein [Microvirga sp. HBU67692]
MQMITPADAQHIDRIIERVQDVQQQTRTTVQLVKATPFATLDHRAQLVAIIAGCHLNAVRLDLRAWAAAPPMQLMHDFHLIRNHYDPATERLNSRKRPLFAIGRPDNPEADLMADNFDGCAHPGLAALAGSTDDDEGGEQ